LDNFYKVSKFDLFFGFLVLSLFEKGSGKMKSRRIPRDKKGIIGRMAADGEWLFRRVDSYLKGRKREYGAKALCGNLALMGAGFLLSGARIYFSASPLGLAFLCAAPNGIPYIFSGVLLSALTGGDEALVFSLSAIFAVGMRVLARCVIEPPQKERISEAMFGESCYLRMATAAVAAFAVGFYRAFVGGFYLYDLCGCITSTVVAPVATALFMPLFVKNQSQLPEKDSPAEKILSEAAYYALLLSITVASAGYEFTGLSPVHIAITVSILYTVRTRGGARGIAAGALCGAVAGFDYALIYAVGAAGAALFMELSMLAAGASLPVCGALRALLFSDGEGFITLFPSQIAGIALFSLISLFGERLDYSSPGVQHNTHGRDASGRERMKELADGFAALAESFSELARTRRRPTEGELRSACDAVCDKVCLKCPNRNLCWNLEYASTLDIISKMCSAVNAKGYVENADLPEYMRARCSSLDRITDGVNEAATQLIRECLEDGRLSGFSADYRAVSAALAEAVAEDLRENCEDAERSDRVRRLFIDSGIRFSSLSVIGRRRITVRAENVNLSRASLRAEELRMRLEKLLGCTLSPPMLYPEGGGMSLELVTRRRFSVSFGSARSAAERGDPCGDSICGIENGEDYFYAVICDGMGQGSRAAFASGVSISFLRQMLEAKMSVETALSVLNAWLRADREECSVSIDILKIDLLNGKAAIYKSGAAASYLRRGKEIFPIESEGFPVGILKNTSAIRTDIELRAGDVIMMGSDGIDPELNIARGREVWLLDLLGSVDPSRPDSATETARKTVSAARSAGSCDDVCAVYVALSAEPFGNE
jgi:stage II sporulation protein E